ncbi:MAG: protein-L-isoaspartate(D-aspartate) O-methyltransferase [Candidatus Atribacteria bacterium]|nr:protein-L-isoaspartate(D-aspartate) O-methyltransferase [Candidatus Atribacteria bacterium]
MNFGSVGKWAKWAVVILLVLLLFFLFSPPLQELSWEETSFSSLREKMIKEQIEARGVSDSWVIEALRQVPRHLFVPENLRSQAYQDRPLPIGFGQTISQPYIVALMSESLGAKLGDKVLEVGTGSGYQAAILAEMGCQVYSVEIVPELADLARGRLSELGYDTVKVRAGDGYLGWEEAAPFDGIIVTCAVDHIPPPLLRQLKEGSRMVIPVGPPWSIQTLWVVEKTDEGVVSHSLGEVRFVPLVRQEFSPE